MIEFVARLNFVCVSMFVFVTVILVFINFWQDCLICKIESVGVNESLTLILGFSNFWQLRLSYFQD